MNRRFVFTLIFGYLVAGTLWLVGGAWIIYHYQLQQTIGSFDVALAIKNISFLIISVISLIYIVNNHYSQLLARKTILNGQLTESETRLKHLLSTYEFVMKATNDVIWDYDITTNQLKWLGGYKEVFGYDNPDELFVKDAFWNMHRVHEHDREETINSFKNFLQTKELKWSAEYRYQCKDGSFKYVSDRGYLILNDNGDPIRMLGAMQDIDVRKKYGLQLEAQNQKLKDIAWLNSHEIRRPLCNMLGLMPLIRTNANDDATLPQLISYLETSANELDETIIRINTQIFN